MAESIRRLDATQFAKGSNCAQSVIAYFAQHPLLEGSSITPAVGAGFGGGLGNTGCICGALAGAAMVLGFYVDTLGLEPVAARMLTEEMTQELEHRFKAQYGSTCCRVIRRKYCEGTADVHHCNALVEFMIDETTEVLEAHQRTLEESQRVARWHVLDILNGAEFVATALFFVMAFVTLAGLFANYNATLRAICAWGLFVLGVFLVGMRIFRFVRYQRGGSHTRPGAQAQ